MSELIISNRKELLDNLILAQDGGIENNTRIQFGDFLNYHITLDGKSFNGGVSGNTLSALNNMQNCLRHSYSFYKHGRPRRLTKEEKELTELVINFERKNSTDIYINILHIMNLLIPLCPLAISPEAMIATASIMLDFKILPFIKARNDIELEAHKSDNELEAHKSDNELEAHKSDNELEAHKSDNELEAHKSDNELKKHALDAKLKTSDLISKNDSASLESFLIYEEEEEIFEAANNTIHKYPEVKKFYNTSLQSQANILYSLKPKEYFVAGKRRISGSEVKSAFEGINFSPEDTELKKSEIIRGNFRILKVDSGNVRDGFRVTLIGDIPRYNRKFYCSISKSLLSMDDKKRILQSAEWDKKPIQMTIGIIIVDEKIVNANLIDVQA